MKKTRSEKRAFWLGFGITLFLLVTVLGMFTVDYQGRKLSFGDSTPLARVDRAGTKAKLTVKAFGREKSWDVTELDKIWEMVLDFGCIPH